MPHGFNLRAGHFNHGVVNAAWAIVFAAISSVPSEMKIITNKGSGMCLWFYADAKITCGRKDQMRVCLSSWRYCTASATCWGPMSLSPAKSLMVRATFSTR